MNFCAEGQARPAEHQMGRHIHLKVLQADGHPTSLRSLASRPPCEHILPASEDCEVGLCEDLVDRA